MKTVIMSPRLVARLSFAFSPLPIVLLVLACTTKQAQTATSLTVRVAADLCSEEASDPNEPDNVKLACQAEGQVSTIVHLLFPSSQWLAMKKKAAPSLDASLPEASAAPAAPTTAPAAPDAAPTATPSLDAAAPSASARMTTVPPPKKK